MNFAQGNMATYEEIKQEILISEDPGPIEMVLDQELPPSAPLVRQRQPKYGLLVNLFVGGFLAAVVCAGSLMVVSNLKTETTRKAEDKHNSSSLLKLFGFNAPTSANKSQQKVILGPGTNFNGSFDLKPQSVPSMDPLSGFSEF